MKAVDVVIVGGGLGGLYSAYQFKHSGVSSLLLEASERYGGRILSQYYSGGADLAVDLGPTWFWPHQRRMHTLLEALDISWFAQHVQGEGLYELHQGVTPQRFSDTHPMPAYRVCGGMQTLTDKLVQTLDPAQILLQHPVTQLDRTIDQWQVVADDNGKMVTIAANYLILAAPPRALLDRLSLVQWLPERLFMRLAATQTWMAGQAKFVATYARPFWRESGLSGDAFSRVGPLVEIHDASADDNAGFALFGFVGVPARAREQFSEADFTKLCLNQLGDLFGDNATQPVSTFLKDWAQDPWVAIGQDLSEPPMPPSLDLGPYKVPLRNLKLCFACSEVADIEGGTLEGALLAAETAVAEIIGLGPQ